MSGAVLSREYKKTISGIGLRRGVRHAALSLVGQFAQFSEGPFLRCLYCHHVFEDQRARFGRLIRRLSRHGTFIDTDALLNLLKGTQPLNGRYFHLSFDDGLKNTFYNAAQVLAEIGVPATFFVPTAFVGTKASEAEYYSQEVLNYNEPLKFMTWNEVRQLEAHGFDVGAHTRHHVRLAEVEDSDRLDQEIRGAKKDVEEALGRSCDIMSWPFGTREDIHRPSRRLFREAGYQAVFGAFRGGISPGETNPYQIPRHHFEVEWPWSHVRVFASGHFE